MSRIDVRKEEPEKVIQIQFSDNTSFAAVLYLNGNDTLGLLSGGGDHECEFKLCDVDNLILALEKAKELWG
jgi:hypothetical protein